MCSEMEQNNTNVTCFIGWIRIIIFTIYSKKSKKCNQISIETARN